MFSSCFTLAEKTGCQVCSGLHPTHSFYVDIHWTKEKPMRKRKIPLGIAATQCEWFTEFSMTLANSDVASCFAFAEEIHGSLIAIVRFQWTFAKANAKIVFDVAADVLFVSGPWWLKDACDVITGFLIFVDSSTCTKYFELLKYSCQCIDGPSWANIFLI